MKTPARRVFTGDRTTDDAQRNGRDATERLNAAAFDGGVLIDAEKGAPPGTGLVFAAGVARSIVHGLGRKARGWIEVYGADLPSAAHVGLCATAHPPGVTSASHVTVTPSSTGTACLFVF